MPVFIFIIIISFLFIFFVFLFLYRRKIRKYLNANFKVLDVGKVSYEFINFEKIKENKFDPEVDSLESQGRTLLKNKVAGIYLSHGTFVGEDPFHLIDYLNSLFPKLNQKMVDKLKVSTKKGQDLFAKDLGNFIGDHEAIFTSMTLGKISTYNFSWSSGNHHFARVKGVLKLIDVIEKNQKKGDRVLLIGHSHAGQLFAILGQVIFNNFLRDELFNVVGDQINLDEYKIKLKKLSTLKYDVVTLGAPARYSWVKHSSYNALHLINHRGDDVLGGDVKGATFTTAGDYIQQWGIAGSDMKSPVQSEHALNLKLDEIFGKGSNLKALKEQIKYRNRLHNTGHHLLIDYGDNSNLPNFFKTIFGHGEYTRIKNLLFTMKEINRYFYD